MGDLSGRDIGRYQIEELLGRGGMGEVYRAQDTTLERAVAIKRLDPQLSSDERYRQNFLREGQHAAILSHQCIATVYDVLEWDGDLLLVMEYVKGKTLSETYRPMELELFLEVSIQCVQALVNAHGHGIVHRDIKPSNIMLTLTGNRVKVLDFGIARRLSISNSDETTLTTGSAFGKVKGTLAYMAPEALTGQEADHRVDIFSLGIVFYEALTGHHPFRENTPVTTVDRILHLVPIPIHQLNPRIPVETSRIVAKMLQKRPEDRYASADDLLVDLRALRRDQHQTVSEEQYLRASNDVKPPKRLKRRIGYVVGALAILMTLAILPSSRMWFRDVLVGWVYPLPSVKTVAILPFEAEGASASQQDMARGISVDLARVLASLPATPAIHMVPSSRARLIPAPEAAARIVGATLVVTGSFKFGSHGLQVDLEVLEGDSGWKLRREGYRQSSTSPLPLVSGLCEVLVDVLELDSVELYHCRNRNLTDDERAYELFLRSLGNLTLPRKARADSEEATRNLLNNALLIDPGFAQARVELGDAYLREASRHRGEDAEVWLARAETACSEAVQEQDDLFRGHYCLAEVAEKRSEDRKVLASLEWAHHLDARDETVLRSLATLYHDLDRHDDEKSLYRKAIERQPSYWRYHYWLCSSSARHGDFEGAVSECEQAVQLAPWYRQAHTMLGSVYSRLARWEEGGQALERSIEIEESVTAYNSLGASYFYRGRFQESIHAWESAIRVSGEKPEYFLYGNLADAYYWVPPRREQERDRALQLYQRALALAEKTLVDNPGGAARVYRRMALYHSMLSHRSEALEYLRKAFQEDAADPDNLRAAAEIHMRFGVKEEALRYLTEALEQGISKQEIRNHPIFEPLEGDERFEALVGQE